MDPDEIAAARRFDESALVCTKSVGPGGPVFTLEIDHDDFYSLPRGAKITNNNNHVKLVTIGALIDATREAISTLVTRYEDEKAAKVQFAKLRDARKSQPEWAGLIPIKLPPSRSRVVEYTRRPVRGCKQN